MASERDLAGPRRAQQAFGDLAGAVRSTDRDAAAERGACGHIGVTNGPQAGLPARSDARRHCTALGEAPVPATVTTWHTPPTLLRGTLDITRNGRDSAASGAGDVAASGDAPRALASNMEAAAEEGSEELSSSAVPILAPSRQTPASSSEYRSLKAVSVRECLLDSLRSSSART